MYRSIGLAQKLPKRHRVAIVLGTNEIASATAVHLCRGGWSVVLSHDPMLPVLRRGMAFHDALYGDPASLEGVIAHRIDFIMECYSVFARENSVAVTPLGLTELLVLGSIDLLIYARMQKYVMKPDLRGLARVAVGLGPEFYVNGNCDIAVETKPGISGAVLTHGITAPADGRSINLGDAGEERFIRADMDGRWRTSLEIGTRVYKGVIIGHHEGDPVKAPIDGILRGMVRDGAEVPAGCKIVEIDPRSGRAAKWTGIDERPRQIAEAVRRAVEIYEKYRGLTQRAPLCQ